MMIMNGKYFIKTFFSEKNDYCKKDCIYLNVKKLPGSYPYLYQNVYHDIYISRHDEVFLHYYRDIFQKYR